MAVSRSVAKPADRLLGKPVVGGADRPDGIERCVVPAGEDRATGEGDQITVSGVLRVRVRANLPPVACLVSLQHAHWRHAPPLIVTYTPPAVRSGDVVTCLYRDGDSVVTGLHDGRIPWPRVRGRESRGGSGLWVNEDLVRAIRTESAAALMNWFGVGSHAAWNRRKRFTGGGKFPTRGSTAAHRKASQTGNEGMKAKEWTDEERDRKAELSNALGLRPGPRWTEDGWTAEQLALLGTDRDEVIAVRVGRSVRAVTVKRVRLKIRAFSGRTGEGMR
ncbi:MAG: hypothetical protein JWO38_6787 [Gemmataceae bacterium]|nr:hypothetical protein [Gemmataceae bacterium]